MKPISDVSVSIQTLKAVATDLFGVPAFFVPGTKAAYVEYADLDSLASDQALYADGYAALSAKAKAFLNQPENAGKFAVITYIAGAIADAYTAFSNKGYFWALLTGDQLAGTVDPTKNDALALSNAIEADAGSRMMIVNTTPANALTNASLFANNTKTVGMYGIANADLTDSSNCLDAALIGKYGSEPVGSVNWHDLAGLVGVKAIDYQLTAADFANLDKAFWVGYVTKINGIAQTSSGHTLSGDYIDQIEGKLWVNSSIQIDLQNLLTNSKKISFDERGAQLISATVDGTLNKAWQQGIVATDATGQAGLYTVSLTPIDQLKPADFEQRAYKGIKFAYTASNGIDTITVLGTVGE